jgi:23S rRNA (pseudouridine1915-N3)-methyltransferase
VVRILFAGRSRAPFLQEGLDQFLPRLRRYSIELVTNPRPGTAKDEEAFFLRHLKAGRTLLALDPRGRAVDSPAFGQLLEATRNPDLLIGGADGLPSAILARSADRLSLSALTFSHELALLVLVEQIYRAETLASGHPYHRA